MSDRPETIGATGVRFYLGMALVVIVFAVTGCAIQPIVDTRADRPIGLEVEQPLYSEDVTFSGGDFTLAGTLTLPARPGPHPGIIAITGSGQQDRDNAHESLPGYRPYREIAEHLAEHGVAVLRVDDRGVGQSTGDATHATSADLAEDTEAALAYLRSRAEIDPNRIGLLGHSEGGMIAAMIAARNPHVAFVISLAGPALDGYQLMTALVERTAAVTEAADPELAAIMRQESVAIDLALAQEWAALEELLATTILTQLESLPAEVQDAIGDLEQVAREQAKVAVVETYQNAWFQFYLRHDPAVDWEQVRVPVLALFAEHDDSIPPDLNISPLEAALARADNTNLAVVVFPDANHLFLQGRLALPPAAPTQTDLIPELLTTLVDWLDAVGMTGR